METNNFIETLNAFTQRMITDKRIEIPCDDCLHVKVCWKAQTDIAEGCSDFQERRMKVKDFKRYFYGSDILVATPQGYVYLSDADEDLLDMEVEEVRASNSVIVV